LIELSGIKINDRESNKNDVTPITC
jgi:hypothetical protein